VNKDKALLLIYTDWNAVAKLCY